jgi:hypothetical protein
MGLEDNKETIRNAFLSYVRYAMDVLMRPATTKETQGSLTLAYIAPIHRLRSVVEGLETSAKFKRLSTAICRVLNKDQFESFVIDSALKNFFKRSHFYADTYDGNKADAERLFGLFWSLLPTRRVTTTRLRLLGRVGFKSKKLTFDLFGIQRFTKRELDRLIDRRTREIFYPETQRDAALLSHFWCIIEETVTEQSLSLRLTVSDIVDSSTKIERTVPDRVIQLLALHEATAGWVGPIWTGLTLPFSFTVHDDLFEAPYSIPEMPDDLLDMLPIDEIKFDREKELALKKIIEKCQRVLDAVKAVDEWNFVEIALGYLGKAFVTHDGLDQILWHVAVLDALLSEENASVRGIMRPRIGNILGTIEADKKRVRKRFDDLYDFRSQLVHGKKYQEKAQDHHAANAREMARQTLMWFFDYLLWIDQKLRERKVTYESYPGRDELLAVLDFDKKSLNRLSLLIGTLPEGFPRINDS